MLYQVEFRPYFRKFRQPLHTYHGVWQIREGIIIRLIDELGNIHWGEIAPIPWFGSETLDQALDFCQALPSKITAEIVAAIPDRLPACQFGFESAIEPNLEPNGEPNLAQLSHSILLPAKAAAISELHKSISTKPTTCDTFKWKIGVASFEEEVEILHHLIRRLPPTAKLRLDANGGLNWEMANRWLETGDRWPQIEFIEQPLGVNQIEEMLKLTQEYQTQIALDESVSNGSRIKACYEQGWRGIFVIKAAIAGSPAQLRKFCKSHKIDAVFSSVFETEIGRLAALKLASELQTPPRAVGFGIGDWFAKEDQHWIEQLWTVR